MEGDRDISLTEQQNKYIEDVFSSLISVFVTLVNPSERLTQQFYDEVLKLGQTAVLLWPPEAESLDELMWMKGYLYQIQGYAYTQKNEYLEAIEAYSQSSELFAKAPRSLLSLESVSRVPDVSIDENQDLGNFTATANEKSSVLALISSASGTFSSVATTNTNLNLAALYLKLNKPSLAKSFYKAALISHQEGATDEQKEDLKYKAKAGEIRYWIAYAEFLSGNLEKAQESMEVALTIHESYSPKEDILDKDDFLSTELTYGYNVAGLGSLSSEINIPSGNSWTEDSEIERDITSSNTNLPHGFLEMLTPFKTDICENTQAYLGCKQRYFSLYIEILMQQHAESPSAFFDVLAFEASERARVRSSRLFQNEKMSEVLATNKRHLLERRDLLNKLFSLENITEEVGEDTLLLEYFLGEERSYLWVISSSNELQTIELPPRAIIEDKAHEFLALLTEPSGRVRPQTTAKVGEELSKMILGPVADQLKQKRLVFVCDGLLQYLPFGALPDITVNGKQTESLVPPDTIQGEFSPYMRPLMINHEIVTLPSGSSLAAIRRESSNNPTPQKELAIYADPVFSHKDSRVKNVKLFSSFEHIELETLNIADVFYSELPNTKQELSQIEQLIPPSERQSYTGYNANLKDVLSTDLGQFRIVHFATHGIFNSSKPKQSGIVLSSLNEQGEIQPGLLSPLDAFNSLNLAGTELVVLSGCRTGLSGDTTIREGLTGLTGGLLAAGADRIVTSLWSVSDDATKELMTRFYTRMLDNENNMTAAQALRDAQISMWGDPKWQMPYYWASFVLQGEWQ